MEGNMKIIIYKLIQFFLVLFLGYVLAKKKIIQENQLSLLSQLVTKVFLPAYTFCSMYNGNTKNQLFAGIPVLLITVIFYLVLIALFSALSRILKLKGERRTVFMALFIFGNTGFVGMPVLQSLYGGEGAINMALFSIIDQAIMWSYGINLCYGGHKGKFQLKKILNPCIFAIAAAMILLLAEIQLPSLVMETIITVGNGNTSVCMLYLGGLMYYSSMRSVLKDKELYIGIITKMIFFPICVNAVLSLLPINDVMRGSLVIIAGLPTMTVIPILAREGSSEGEYAAGITMITLLTCLITLPLIALTI